VKTEKKTETANILTQTSFDSFCGDLAKAIYNNPHHFSLQSHQVANNGDLKFSGGLNGCYRL